MSQELPSNLIVNYIPREFTDELLNKLFAQFGDIESARIIRDKLSNETKGYGFVKFVSGESAAKAIQTLNGFEILGKRLKLSYSHHNKAPIPQPVVEKAVSPTVQPLSQTQLQAPNSMVFVMPRPLSPQLQFANPLSPTARSEVDMSESSAAVSPSYATISPRQFPLSPALSPSCVPLMIHPQLYFPNQMTMNAPMTMSMQGAMDPRMFPFGTVPLVSLSALNMM